MFQINPVDMIMSMMNRQYGTTDIPTLIVQAVKSNPQLKQALEANKDKTLGQFIEENKIGDILK